MQDVIECKEKKYYLSVQLMNMEHNRCTSENEEKTYEIAKRYHDMIVEDVNLATSH